MLLIATQLPERSNVADPVVPDESSVAVLPGSDSTPGDVAKAHNELNAHAPDSRTSSRLRLFARVRGHVPVLQIDRDAQRISVVGWVEAEQSIPVDLRYVPDRQQETFNAVLQGDSDPISL